MRRWHGSVAFAQRKGVAYTLVAIIILLAVGTIFFTQARRTGHESTEAVSDRVRSVDRFIVDLKVDSDRAARIAGFRSLIAMEQRVASTGQYFTDPDAAMLDIFWDGNYTNTTFFVMDNSSFSEYLLRIQYEAGKEGIAVNLSVGEVRLWQEDPWHLLVNYTILANISDARGTAQWRTSWNGTGRIPITDLRDPLFTAETLGRVQRVIKQTNVTQFVDDVGDANDTSGMIIHFNESFYAALGRGPDILMRFAGNTSDSQYGIESLVDREGLIAQDIDVDSSASVVDYLYFNSTDATECSIQNLPTRLILDEASADAYGVTGALTTSICP